jgi:hypothetical protein
VDEGGAFADDAVSLVHVGGCVEYEEDALEHEGDLLGHVAERVVPEGDLLVSEVIRLGREEGRLVRAKRDRRVRFSSN